MLGAILVLAAFLNFGHAGFPVELHPDEGTKVGFVLTGTQDFKHPVLLLQLVRGFRWIAPTDDPQRIAAMGRRMSGLAGIAVVAFAYLLFRRSLGIAFALLGALLLAVTPVLVVHAHYFKEDVLLTATCLAALLALCRFVEARPTATLELAVALGLACATHYKAALVAVVCLATPGIVAVGPWGGWYRRLLPAFGIAVVVFLAANVPMLRDPAAALAGARFEMVHAASGHHVAIGGPAEQGAVHLRRSLLPGLTAPLALLAAAGLIVAILARRTAASATTFLLAFGAVAYVVVELSPLKPAPGFMRYVLPVVPALILAACLALRELAVRLGTTFGWVTVLVVVAAIAFPATRSLRLVRHLDDDSRVRAAAWLQAHDARPLRELYAGRPVDRISVADVDLAAARAAGATHVVATSFIYERVTSGAARSHTDGDLAHEYAEKYRRLFTLPYVEIPPTYMTFAFSDPTVRIVDIRGIAAEAAPVVSR